MLGPAHAALVFDVIAIVLQATGGHRMRFLLCICCCVDRAVWWVSLWHHILQAYFNGEERLRASLKKFICAFIS